MRALSFILVLAASMALYGCGEPDVGFRKDDVVSWESLLMDATELMPPQLGAALLFSSAAGTGNAVLTGESPQIYGDLDHGSFLKVRNVPGGVEAILLEREGAGAITWMWSANPVGELVLQIDGKETVYPFKSFLMGKWLPEGYPFSSKTAEGYNLHFPLLHKTHCRVAIRAKSRRELGALFYQVAWNPIEPESKIKSFDLSEIRNSKSRLKRVAGLLLHPPKFTLQEMFTGSVAPGAFEDVLSIPGSGNIQCLEISAHSKEELSDVYIEAFWDGANVPALACPLHMLCGVSRRFENVRALPVTVKGSAATLRWPMPFSKGALIRVRNIGEDDIGLRVSASVDFGASVSRRFHGGFSTHENLLMDEPNMLNLAEISGKGALVGCILQVENRSGVWWGEGDPLIWLDSDEHPVWHGTGTEDYFGFAWCSTKEFQHPFRGQTRASPSFASLYRYHIIDPLPFDEWARFDFEAHGIGSGLMDYSALVLWYSDSNSTNFRNDSK